MKKYIKNKFSDFFFFYQYLGSKVFVSLFLSFFVGLMDGLGLAMFIPLLQMVDGSSEFQANQETIGNLSYLIDALSFLGLKLNLTIILFIILFFFSLKGIFKFLESYYNVVLTTNFAKKIRIEAVEALSELNFKYFLKLDQGRIQNSLSEETNRVRMAFVYYSSTIQSLISVFVYVTLAFLTNPQFAVLVFIGGSLSNFFYRRLYKLTKITSKSYTNKSHSFQGLVIQQVNNFKYLRSTGQIEIYTQKVKEAIVDLAEYLRRLGFFNSLLVAIKEPISIAVVVLVILIQVNLFSVALGSMILSLLFFYRSLNQLVAFQNSWNNFLNVSGSLVNYQEFISELITNRVSYSEGIKVTAIESIELKEIDFYFNDKKFFDGLNLKISKNKTIAFVGSSGSGKTTLSNIVTGLLPYDKGQILINGKELSTLNLNTYQSKIGYITQETVIFNDDLYNNVTFWAPKTPENLSKFRECIQKASLNEFVENSIDGENTALGINGVLISGGQKQRIGIARELFKDVDLLILDEATSALDSTTELEIQSYFDQLKGNFTILVIAHRLSTIKNADEIYLLNNGKIQAKGDFLRLQEVSPEFKRMVALQDFSFVD
jgi:ABC-type multidrug transport system fused ATPase/permease subunit